MEKIIAALLCCVVFGCGSSVILDTEESDNSSSSSGPNIGGDAEGGSDVGEGGDVSASGGTGGAGGACERGLTVEEVSHTTDLIPDGSFGNEILKLKLTASDCGDIDVKNASFQLVSLDDDPTNSTPFCDAPCATPDDWNFRNAKIKDANGVTWMGPVEFRAAAENQPARADFNDSFTVTSGTSVELTFTMDFAPPHLNVDGRRYRLFLLDVGSNADVQTSVNNVPTDAAFQVFDFDAKLALTLSSLTPPSHNIVAGKDVWENFAVYKVYNFTADPQTIDAAEIAQADPNGDVADFSSVALAMDGVTQLTGNQVIVAGNEKHFFIHDPTPGQNFTIPAGSTKTVQVWGKVAAVIPGSAANGAWHGVPRSGHTPSLRIENVHVTSDPSFFAQAPATVVNPPSMLIRKTKPLVFDQPLSTSTLANIDQDLAKWQISADAMGSVEVKKLAFKVNMTENVTLSSFRIRRGATDLDISSYDVLTTCTESPCTHIVQIVIVFNSAETIVGSGNVYTLHATVNGAVAGESITLSFVQTTEETPVTGKLTWWGGGSYGPYLVPANWQPNDNIPAEYLAGMFLWSDGSETPHWESSADWTNDVWLVDIQPMSWSLSL